MTHIPEEQLKSESTVEKAVVKTPEVLSSPHDILGKEYEFNEVSFTVLGMQPVYSDDSDDEGKDLSLDSFTVIDMQSQRVPVIPFQGGVACITKIRIGDEVITDYAEIVKNILIVEQAPDGWMTNKGLAEELKVAEPTTSRLANSYHQSHLEWLHYYKSKNGQVRQHYAPELCDIIRDEVNKVTIAPEDWKTNAEMTQELKVGAKTIARYSEFYRQSYPEWFRDFKSRGRVYKYFSVDLCIAIKNEIIKIPLAPDGWMTRSSLSNELQKSMHLLRRLADEYKNTHPQWFRDYRIPGGRICEFYDPELCDIIREKLSQYEYAPEDWMTNMSLAKEFKNNFMRIKLLANLHRHLHPEWFHDYLDKAGNLHEHYSPELCDLIRQAVKDKQS